MTPTFPFRAALASLVVSAVSVYAQTAKPAVNQGPYQPQAQASPFNGKIVEDVVARVNDQIITSSDYERASQQLDSEARQQNWSEQEIAQRKKDLLRDQIDKELLLSKGKELGITGETELVKRLDEIRKQNHLESMEDLEKAAQEQGVSYEDFKQNIRSEIISQQVIRDQVSRKIQLTKTDVANFYDAHKAEFEQPESVHLSEILIPVPSDDAAGLAQAQAKADDIEAKLKAGGNFEELAKKESTGPTAQTGGDLGDFKRGMLAKPLEDATFALQAGQVAPPIRTKQGLLILKVMQHAGGAAQDFTAIQPQVEEAAFMTRMQPALRAYLTTLREQAYIDVRPGFQDAGAAKRSVKPLYSAYTQPSVKKKKVQRVNYRQAAHGFRSKTAASTASAKAVGPPAAATPATAVPATDAAVAASTPSTAPAAAAGATSAPTQTAKNVPSGKPVRKQKVRFGQAPQDTLSALPGSSTIATNGTSGADASSAAAETQVASNASSGSDAGLEPAPAIAKTKTRFAARAREPKQKKADTPDQLEDAAAGQATPEELAAQKEQAAPLGLEGDTAKKKKAPKVKSDEKTRYSQDTKPKSTDDTQPAAGTDTALPADTPPVEQAPAAQQTPPAQQNPAPAQQNPSVPSTQPAPQ